MPTSPSTDAASLTSRRPTLSGTEIVDHLVPPRQFRNATFDSYRPDPDYPSQQAALDAVRRFASVWTPSRSSLFGRRRRNEELPGIYFDGGFGVGKTHLLAALWHSAPGRKYFGTFIEYTALVGALGYSATVDLLRGATLLCIDEFELDDPGDTRLMARLLGDLANSGTRLAATSNTPPNALGDGRFAAVDFLREIDSLAARFTIIRIDGLDYRRRALDGHAVSVSDVEFANAMEEIAGPVTIDDFESVVHHLSTVHPSRYTKFVEGLAGVGFRNVTVLHSQTDALRFVAFVDRLYDARVRVIATGIPLDQVFPDDMLAGGFRKKYLRAASRLMSLTSQEQD
ncbi:cell division protein ZapE [Cryobacterium mesophilum]|uniref:cell division protein ZapE n=1 Tax=Terrimesophilobacter mesophilus TaxID=433647 RepID=UPI0017FA1019|nr:cell division protein ZapE [Terrimesophilobacter mesophilus]MBB5631842.1 cell division protein ZapE [Terrimesophilobacter mesophilus]